MKASMGTLRKESIIKVTCWELKSHPFKALVLPTFTYGTKIWGGGGDLETSHWKVFEKGMKMHIMSYVKVHFSTTYHIPIELHSLKLTIQAFNDGSPCIPLLVSQ